MRSPDLFDDFLELAGNIAYVCLEPVMREDERKARASVVQPDLDGVMKAELNPRALDLPARRSLHCDFDLRYLLCHDAANRLHTCEALGIASGRGASREWRLVSGPMAAAT
jgi:hypothetical protein